MTSLIAVDFGGGSPSVTADVPTDVTSSSFSVGTVNGSGFVQFGGGSFEVTGFDFTTVGISASNIGNVPGYEVGLGTSAPGLGAWLAPDGGIGAMGSELKNNNNGAEIHRLALSFTQPVVLTTVNAAWWDDAGISPETWEVTVDGATAIADSTSEGSLDLTLTSLPQTSTHGVTGVFLMPGQTIEFGASGPDVWDRANAQPGQDGHLDTGVLGGLELYVVIPEPTSLALLGLASLGLIRRRR
ncbi:PEP-CTERM sorting domain-containing protein [Akkermansiaceae bacterium]|nr:PEP-CTERM sorting domain-containing protein [Akkermansiaceae bacterium]